MLVMHSYMSGFLRQAITISLLSVVLLSSACTLLATPPADTPTANARAQSLNEDLLYELLAAEFAGNAGDLQAAVNFYQQAALSSDDSRIAARATYIALYGQQYEQALELLARWRELEPEAVEVDRIYALSYLHLHRPLEALLHVQAVLAQTSASTQEKAMVVKQLLSDEIEPQDSLGLLVALNQAQTDNPQMLILQAKYSAELEQYEESIQALDRALEIDPALVDVNLIKARIYQAQGNREAAKAVIMQVLKDHPDDLGLRMQYARMLVEDRDYEAAREQFLVLREKQPDNVEVLFNLALLYIETDQLDESAELLNRLVELDQKTDIAHYYLGRIEQSKEQHKSAIAHYIKVNSGAYMLEAKLRIASLFARLERVDEAIEQLDVLLEETEEWPDSVRIYLTQGEIFRSHQRYQDGFDMYSRALGFNPDDINLLYARALIAEKVDRIDVAEADLLKVLSMEPDNADALNALGYTLADKTQRYQEAKAYIQKAIELVPDDPAIMDSMGWVHYRLGELQEALKWLSQAFEKLADAEIAAHYGEVLWQAGEQDKARAIWQQGQAVDAKHPVLVETLKRLQP